MGLGGGARAGEEGDVAMLLRVFDNEFFLVDGDPY